MTSELAAIALSIQLLNRRSIFNGCDEHRQAAGNLSGIISQYLNKFPEVSLDVLLEDKYTDLLENRIDVAIRIGRLEDPGLVTRRLAPCNMVLCASPDYLKKHGTPEKPADISHAPRLAFSQSITAGDWTLFDAKGRAYPIEGAPLVTANNMQLLLMSALNGSGIAYGPDFVFSDSLQKGSLIRLLPGYRTTELNIQAVLPQRVTHPV